MSRSDERRVRAAVVGCGRTGAILAGAAAVSPEATLVGVCDTVRAQAEALGSAVGVPFTTDLAAMLRDVRPDVVIAAVPDDRRPDLLRAVRDAGCHAWCEAPLARDLATATELVDAAEAAGAMLAVGVARRHGFAYQKARALLDAGAVGPPGRMLLHVIDRPPTGDMLRDATALLRHLLPPYLDLARWLMSEVTVVHARLNNPSPGSAVRRSAVVSLAFANGGVGVLAAGYVPGLARTTERLEVGGDRGWLAAEDVTRRVSLYREDPDHAEVWQGNPSIRGDAFAETVGADLRDFLARMAEGKPPAATGRDALRAQEIAEAAVQSFDAGGPVVVTPR